jgi:hypothetical protein
MRYREFLLESSYDSMIVSLKNQYRGSKQREFIDNCVLFAKTKLKKDERVVWFLRIARSILFDIKNKTNTRFELIGYNTVPTKFLTYTVPYFEDELRVAEHINQGNVKFDNYIFGNKSLSTVIHDFNNISEEWKVKKSLKKVPIQPGDKKLIDFGDGSAWWFLDRAACEKEATAGRHCGNRPNQWRSNHRLLSYRENGRVKMTFVLETDTGMLLDRRAVANQHPDPKYYEKIIALLKLPIITDLLPKDVRNDFQLSNLSPAQQHQLRIEKPSLFKQTDKWEAD